MRRVAMSMAALLTALMCFAQDTTLPKGYHEHDGFFLSMSLGGGYCSIDDKYGSLALTYSGAGTPIDVRIGGTIGENLMLSGDIIGFGIPSPNVSGSLNGQMSGSTTMYQDIFGIGLTYYLMPANFFVAGTLGMGGFSLQEGSTTVNTHAGLGLYFKLGKECWVAPDWALGVAGSVGWCKTTTNTTTGSETLTGYFVGVHFNATYQ